MTDLLQEMLKIQKGFQDKYGYKDPLIHNACSALMSEGGETWAASGGKWWKQYIEGAWGMMGEEDARKYILSVELRNRDKIIEESIDILHFLLIIWLRLGLTADSIFKAYTEKMGVNMKRQEEGY